MTSSCGDCSRQETRAAAAADSVSTTACAFRVSPSHAESFRVIPLWRRTASAAAAGAFRVIPRKSSASFRIIPSHPESSRVIPGLSTSFVTADPVPTAARPKPISAWAGPAQAQADNRSVYGAVCFRRADLAVEERLDSSIRRCDECAEMSDRLIDFRPSSTSGGVPRASTCAIIGGLRPGATWRFLWRHGEPRRPPCAATGAESQLLGGRRHQSLWIFVLSWGFVIGGQACREWIALESGLCCSPRRRWSWASGLPLASGASKEIS